MKKVSPVIKLALVDGIWQLPVKKSTEEAFKHILEERLEFCPEPGWIPYSAGFFQEDEPDVLAWAMKKIQDLDIEVMT
jgi:hypothetical protein